MGLMIYFDQLSLFMFCRVSKIGHGFSWWTRSLENIARSRAAGQNPPIGSFLSMSFADSIALPKTNTGPLGSLRYLLWRVWNVLPNRGLRMRQLWKPSLRNCPNTPVEKEEVPWRKLWQKSNPWASLGSSRSKETQCMLWAYNGYSGYSTSQPFDRDTSSTAQGGGGSFKNRKLIGEISCCESRMAERIYWWTDRWLELCFLECLQWLQWSPYHNCWM